MNTNMLGTAISRSAIGKKILILAAILVTLNVLGQKKQVVFVCEHGSAKSVIAATYFNKLAKERNLPFEAVARGTNPDSAISPKTKKLLTDDNLFDKTLTPKKISQTDVDGAEQVFLFFPLPQNINGHKKVTNWLEVQAVNEDFPKLRDDILKKITPLLDSLSKK